MPWLRFSQISTSPSNSSPFALLTADLYTSIHTLTPTHVHRNLLCSRVRGKKECALPNRISRELSQHTCFVIINRSNPQHFLYQNSSLLLSTNFDVSNDLHSLYFLFIQSLNSIKQNERKWNKWNEIKWNEMGTL